VNQLPIRPGALVMQHAADAVISFRQQQGIDAALGFVDALEHAFNLIAEDPERGATEQAAWLQLPRLRHWPLCGFPYLLYYVNAGSHVHVWQLLPVAFEAPGNS